MYREHKPKKKLENFLRNEEKKQCKEIINEINIYNKIKEINSPFLNKKRERRKSESSNSNKKQKEINENKISNINNKDSIKSNHQSPNKKLNTNTEIPDNTKEKKDIDLSTTIEKIFQIAEIHKSFEHTIKLLKFVILKIKNIEDPNKKLSLLIKVFYKIIFSKYKNHPLTILPQYLEIYNLALSTLNEEDKKNNLYKIFLLSKIVFEDEMFLYKDDTFSFNNTKKKIFDIFINLEDYNIDLCDEEKEYNNFIEIMNSKNDVTYNENIEKTLYRKMIGLLLLNMHIYCCNNVKVFVKQVYRDIILNYPNKLSCNMIQELKEGLCIIDKKNNSNNLKLNKVDDGIKNNPTESYYEVKDAREEKLILSSFDKWQSKNIEIKQTQQYFG